ncbi:hypothetical protein [Streptomyces ortus]|uniref:Integral membrane protein n=1 Tax=Streptomyces ortus TaxID=2867268 RepID=A0ABT3VAH5_9ACTN|nr:hypothetical protein [Streptomyces ortus]MCX4236771.1 hypothetical protein [Streptomyces ortus]
MLALRLVRGANPAVQFRRLLVAAASAGTGFLLLCTLGYAMGHPEASTAAVLRLAWCLAPIAATVQFAVAVARTDPATRPRTGLAAIGLGPAQLMILAAVSTAVSCTLGSMVALLFFLHLRGDLTGLPFDGAAAGLLAANQPLRLPATLTLLAVVPVLASAASAVVLRPRGPRPSAAAAGGRPGRLGGSGGYGRSTERVGSSAYGRFGARATGSTPPPPPTPAEGRETATQTAPALSTDGSPPEGAGGPARQAASVDPHNPGHPTPEGARGTPQSAPTDPHHPRDQHAVAALDALDARDAADHSTVLPEVRRTARRAPATQQYPATPPHPQRPPGCRRAGRGSRRGDVRRPWRDAHQGPALPGGFTGGPFGVLVGWALTALGLALAGPARTHLCGRLLQSVRPSAPRLLAGRVLMEEATRIGRPLGVVCAVASGLYAMAVLYAGTRPGIGPLTTLGLVLVAGCAVATLLTAAVEARNARADTTAALLRIGAPAATLRTAATLRAGALLAVLTPLTWAIAELAAMPLAR